jgi:hypothetical protein
MGHSQRVTLARVAIREIFSAQRDSSTRGLPKTRERLDKFGLAIALDTSNADDLA